MNELIICEKPSSSEKIAKALSSKANKMKYGKKVFYWELEKDGKDITVLSAVGHLFSLTPKNQRERFYFDLKWVPLYETDKSKGYVKEYLAAIKKFTKKADTFVHACDYDIEGTLIGYNALLYTVGQKAIDNISRMKFSTLTKKDILAAYENKIDLDLNQVDSGIARHILDFIFGVNISKALTQSVRSAKKKFLKLSAGRVQTPSLAILVEREKEIQKFVPEPFWLIKALLDGYKDLIADHVDGKIFDKKKAHEIYEKCQNQDATVDKVKVSASKRKPPIPFNLGGLQSEAYNVFGYSPKKTQTIAQSLYTNGYTSYPRTSSQKLPETLELEDILDDLSKSSLFKPHIDEVYEENNIDKPNEKASEEANGSKASKKLKPNQGKKDDPAHPAIHPTGILPKKLDDDENKIYQLITFRFISVFSVDAVIDSMRADLNIVNEKFFFRRKQYSFLGWLKHYPFRKLENEDFPEIKKGDILKVKKLTSDEKETKPPARYNQASLIKELEKRELGTKATRADIIAKLFDRDYISGTKQIEVNSLGEHIVDTLSEYASDLTNEELTRSFERDLDKIMDEKIKKYQVIDNAKEEVKLILNDVDKNQIKIGEELFDAYQESMIISKCACGGNLSIKYSPRFKSNFIGCSNFPDCDVTYSLPRGATVLKSRCDKCGLPMISFGSAKNRQRACLDPNCGKENRDYSPEVIGKCPECGNDLLKRSGRYGEFIGCSNFPRCKFTSSIEDLEKNLSKTDGSKSEQNADSKTEN
ncbi:DNA topoisomerase I [Methanobrevibacter curvatus]|uniref:DNA topoisomerase 1 n=1 Tax=Methanobrevibacter curvatus TaxID=49547 RepID=A0A166BJD6_9EURY|nr:DNA topoisomerase I [Methanobrevibacter curvatus]KZX13434.1 DNA topoisomerase 1 [Methanobrevibacter curvatus]